MRQSDWYKAVLFFDAYCGSLPDAPPAEAMPATCAAVVALVHKLDKSEVPYKMKPGLASYVEMVCHLADVLEVGKADIESVVTAERCILDALKWTTNVPAVDVWVSTIWKRMNIFMEGHGSQQLQQMDPAKNTIITSWMRYLMYAQATNSSLSSKEVACGLFCFGLVNVALLPAASFELADDEWEKRSKLQLRPPHCTASAQQLAELLGKLEVASGRPWIQMKEDFRKVTALLMSVSAGIESDAPPLVHHSCV
jgi:hypothetical protein